MVICNRGEMVIICQIYKSRAKSFMISALALTKREHYNVCKLTMYSDKQHKQTNEVIKYSTSKFD